MSMVPPFARHLLKFRAAPARQILRAMGDVVEGPVAKSIEEKLSRAFKASHLQVLNQSFMHNVPAGSETHFKVVVVSDSFEGQTALQRHRSVNAALAEELGGGVHALSIVARTPKQWLEDDTVDPDPKCRGGFGK